MGEVEHVLSPERISWTPHRAYKRRICRAVTSGDWINASSYDSTHPNWVSTPLTEGGDTALHVAVSMKHIYFVKKLVERMSNQEVEIPKIDGNTAFCMAAILGNVEIARILLNKNPRLVWIRGHENMLPIELAFLSGQLCMVNFLYEETRHDMHVHLSFQDIVRLFFLTLANNAYSVASILLDTYPRLASAENDKGLTALEVLAQLPFDRKAPGYEDILSSLFKLMEEEEFPNFERSTKAMFDAVESGNTMILEFIFGCNPDLLLKVNSKGQSLLHIAILHRHLTVYQLILSMGAYLSAIINVVDNEGNNVLHLAGKFAAEERFGSPVHHFLIRSEELWFKEVEKIVPPAFKIMKNGKGYTPQELFYWEHKEFSEKAISSLSDLANNFIVVGTLVVSLGITAALTLRTNPIGGETPIFNPKTWYILFILSSAFGLSFTVVSMLHFTSVILPSTWMQKHGYVNARITRVTWGCLSLYAAVGILGTFTISSGAVLVYTFSPKWILCVVVALIGIPFLMSFMIYDYSFQFSLELLLALGKQSTMTRLSRT